ncbi:MAG: lamin tail domain-containing protein [Candidatus Paceibacterota bacterium]
MTFLKENKQAFLLIALGAFVGSSLSTVVDAAFSKVAGAFQKEEQFELLATTREAYTQQEVLPVAVLPEEKVLGVSSPVAYQGVATKSKEEVPGVFVDSSQPKVRKEILAESKSTKRVKSEDTECEFTTDFLPDQSTVIFNEVNWAGDKDSSNNEWIELKNISDKEKDISGWAIIDKAEQIKITITDGVLLPEAALYLVKRGERVLTKIEAPLYTGALANTDEGLRLFDESCRLQDEVLAAPNWPAGNSAKRLTAQRAPDLSWYSSHQTGGSPAKNNPIEIVVKKTNNSQDKENQQAEQSEEDAKLGIFEDEEAVVIETEEPEEKPEMQQEAKRLIIQSVQITGGQGLTTNDLIVIKNDSDEEVNLNGYRLVKRTKTGSTDSSIKSFTEDVFLQPGETYMWANSNYTDVQADTRTSASISNDNGVAIRFGDQDTGQITDSVAWGSAENIFAETAPYPENPGANKRLERLQDTDNNANDFSIK